MGLTSHSTGMKSVDSGLNVKTESKGQNCCHSGESQCGEKHGVQQFDGNETAHRELAGKDSGKCTGVLQNREEFLCHDRYTRHLLSDGTFRGRGSCQRFYLF